MKDHNTQTPTVLDVEKLKSMGKVMSHEPTPLTPYDINRQGGSFGIVQTANPPKQFEFELK